MSIKKKRVVIILQARMGASRLPGKPLKKVQNRPLLSYQLERLSRVKLANEIVVATTTEERDMQIVNLCRKEGVSVYRGSTQDVLDRYFQAAQTYQADVIVRITGDCPLIDPEIVDQLIQYYLDHSFDYVSNSLERTYPRGLDAEIFSFDMLEKAHHEAAHLEEREHVTPYFYNHPKLFSLGSIKQATDLSFHRWTVDTVEDLDLITKILEALYPKKRNFTTQDIIKEFELHPEWTKINSHIQQKTLKSKLRPKSRTSTAELDK